MKGENSISSWEKGMKWRFIYLFKFFLFLTSLFWLSCSPGGGGGDKTKRECESNSDCNDFADKCDTAVGKCVKIVCQSRRDCRGNWYCNYLTNRCQPTPGLRCQEDFDCPTGKTCQNGSCVNPPPKCKSDGDCPDPTEPFCQNGKCVTKDCKEAADCGEGRYECTGGKCRRKKAECKDNNDCTDAIKSVCKDGVCVEPTDCTDDIDCTNPAKPRCINGKCAADTGKEEGEKCKIGSIPCKLGLICYTPDPTKPDGECRKRCNPLLPRCPTDRLCHQLKDTTGVCLPPNNGKKAGESCEKEQCEVDLTCVEWKLKKVCAKPCDPKDNTCEPGEECYEVIPKRYYCVSERDPCGVGRPCPKHFTCIGGRCNPPPSCSTVKCKQDEVCEFGVCRKKKCPDEITCPQDSECDKKTGRCVRKGDPGCIPCTGASNSCPNSGDLCLSGFGSTPTEAYCFAQCAGGKPCPNPQNFECRKLSISLTNVTCRSNADCRVPGYACNTTTGQCTRTVELCVPKINTCKNLCIGKTCPSGQKCVPRTGKCVVTGKPICSPCTTNDECGGPDDLCLRLSNGNFCGKDCTTTNSCPSGYQCYGLQNSNKRQCAPPARNNAVTCPLTP